MSQNTLNLHMVARTNVGKVRDHNEDNFIVTDNYTQNWIVPNQSYANSTYGTIMVIADGMGGLNAGEIASKITVESIKDYFTNLGNDSLTESTYQQRLTDAILYAHQQILAYAKVNTEAEGMGTTVILAQIVGNKVYAAWSGDSRCYLHRNDKLTQLTKDHSYVQALLDEGKITKEQAFYHPQSNIITQSLGDAERSPSPDFISEQLYKDDIILMCSDGLNAMLEDTAIEELIHTNQTDISLCNESLIQAANSAGGNDNITVIINRIVDGDENPFISKKYEEVVLPETTVDINTNKDKKQHISVLSMLLLGALFGVGALFGWYVLNNNKEEKNKKSVTVAKTDSTKKNDSIKKADSKIVETPRDKSNQNTTHITDRNDLNKGNNSNKKNGSNIKNDTSKKGGGVVNEKETKDILNKLNKLNSANPRNSVNSENPEDPENNLSETIKNGIKSEKDPDKPITKGAESPQGKKNKAENRTENKADKKVDAVLQKLPNNPTKTNQ